MKNEWVFKNVILNVFKQPLFNEYDLEPNDDPTHLGIQNVNSFGLATYQVRMIYMLSVIAIALIVFFVIGKKHNERSVVQLPSAAGLFKRRSGPVETNLRLSGNKTSSLHEFKKSILENPKFNQENSSSSVTPSSATTSSA